MEKPEDPKKTVSLHTTLLCIAKQSAWYDVGMNIVQIFQHADFKQPWRVYVETMPAGEELLLHTYTKFNVHVDIYNLMLTASMYMCTGYWGSYMCTKMHVFA